MEKRKLKEANTDLQNEYDYLKKSKKIDYIDYDKLFIDCAEIKKELVKKNELVNKLSSEGEEMKNAINKLTEVRVILNKQFSVNQDNYS